MLTFWLNFWTENLLIALHHKSLGKFFVWHYFLSIVNLFEKFFFFGFFSIRPDNLN